LCSDGEKSSTFAVLFNAPRAQDEAMKYLLTATLGLQFVVATAAFADTPAMATYTAPIKPMTMTCRDFLSYDVVTRPQIVYWSEALNQKGKPQDAQIDVDSINSLVPVLVQDCQREPQSSFWTKMKNDFKSAF
jgi:acid stress chaperone HdeA